MLSIFSGTLSFHCKPFIFVLILEFCRQHTMKGRSLDLIWGRNQNSPLTTNLKKKFIEASKGISYPIGDICRHFTKLTGLSAYTSNTAIRWYKWPFVTCRIHLKNSLPMFPGIFFSSYCEGVLPFSCLLQPQ